jgi:hypothetical protein
MTIKDVSMTNRENGTNYSKLNDMPGAWQEVALLGGSALSFLSEAQNN